MELCVLSIFSVLDGEIQSVVFFTSNKSWPASSYQPLEKGKPKIVKQEMEAKK